MLARVLWGVVLSVSVMSAGICAGNEIGPEIGTVSPNLIGRTMDGQPYRLKNDKAMPKVINFFSVTCKPCRKEMPELATLEKQYPGVRFISVHTEPESAENIDKFIKSLSGAPSNIVQTFGGLQETFHYIGLPHTLVLDAENIVLLNLVGFTPNNMKRLSKKLQSMTNSIKDGSH